MQVSAAGPASLSFPMQADHRVPVEVPRVRQNTRYCSELLCEVEGPGRCFGGFVDRPGQVSQLCGAIEANVETPRSPDDHTDQMDRALVCRQKIDACLCVC